MIKDHEADFQNTEDSPLDWCETNFFSWNIPEANILGYFYLLTRPVLGVCMSDVTIQDRISPVWEDQLYVDNRQHLPCPKSLLSYALPNGLSVKCLEPLHRYQIDFTGFDDTEIHLESTSLMRPWDMHDPDMDPSARKGMSSHWSFNGHFELTSRIVGEAKIRGTKYAVDCVDTHDRSWGARPEIERPNAIWLHASFGQRLTLHLLTFSDIAATSEFGRLLSGYVLEDGQVFGIVEARGRSERSGIFPLSTYLEAVDARGKKFVMTGAVMNAARWEPYSCMSYPQSFMRWNCNGEIGYGLQQDANSRGYLCRNRDRIRLA
jgi:hypothetical protein